MQVLVHRDTPTSHAWTLLIAHTSLVEPQSTSSGDPPSCTMYTRGTGLLDHPVVAASAVASSSCSFPYIYIETLRYWGSETLRYWGSETLRYWGSETLRYWGSETLRYWGSETLRYWGSEILGL
ncbi:UNVERIFIED_CONTAM: hypothetical protein FKN15_060978 [Acipenser sinensis]